MKNFIIDLMILNKESDYFFIPDNLCYFEQLLHDLLLMFNILYFRIA